MSYEPYEALIAPARSKASILRLIFGIVITALMYMLLLRLSWQVVLQISGPTWFEQTMQVPGPSSPSQMFILLGSFGFMTAAVSFTVWFLHHHSQLALIGDLARAKGQFLQSAGKLFFIAAGATAIANYGETLMPNLPLIQWLVLLPITLAFLFIQFSADELVFR